MRGHASNVMAKSMPQDHGLASILGQNHRRHVTRKIAKRNPFEWAKAFTYASRLRAQNTIAPLRQKACQQIIIIRVAGLGRQKHQQAAMPLGPDHNPDLAMTDIRHMTTHCHHRSPSMKLQPIIHIIDL